MTVWRAWAAEWLACFLMGLARVRGTVLGSTMVGIVAWMDLAGWWDGDEAWFVTYCKDVCNEGRIGNTVYDAVQSCSRPVSRHLHSLTPIKDIEPASLPPIACPNPPRSHHHPIHPLDLLSHRRHVSPPRLTRRLQRLSSSRVPAPPTSPVCWDPTQALRHHRIIALIPMSLPTSHKTSPSPSSRHVSLLPRRHRALPGPQLAAAV